MSISVALVGHLSQPVDPPADIGFVSPVIIKNSFQHKTWLLRWALWSIPVPWIAIQCGWIVAEYGRQPWTVFGLLPTHLSVSSLSTANIWGSLAGFLGFYTLLLVAELYLMFKYARLGPSALQAQNV